MSSPADVPARSTHDHDSASAARGGATAGALTGVRLVAARELRALFASAVAPVFLIAGLVLLNSLYMNEFFLAGRLDMTPLFDALGVLAALLVPAITMRLWAEERRRRTFELWMTLPLAPWQVVVGKYLAALALFALFLVGTLPVVAMLVSLGEPDLGVIAASYVGALCLGSLLASAGLFLSSLCRDQITAYLLAVLAGALFLATGHPRVALVVDGMAPDLAVGRVLADSFSSLPRYEAFLRGRVEPASLVHFVGWTVAFLAANASAVRRLRP